jgi:beta-mannosidase
MGIMYWQIDDIWQAPTWATLDYAQKWKMGHYYVQHMYEPVYPLAILKPYLADVMDENARISIYFINELFNGASGRLTCSFLLLDTFSAKSSVAFDISFNAPGVKNITDLPYSTVMRSAGCSNGSQCVFHCSFNSTQEDIGQTLFLTQPKNYQLYQPNLRVESIKQVSTTEVSITITATRPALFVWLSVSPDILGYFSRNGFHMFGPTRTVSFHTWFPMTDFQNANFNVAITSLFDVTQP